MPRFPTLLAVLLSACILSSANATVVVDSDFSGPTFSNGDLPGQNGYVGHGAPNAWQVDATAGKVTSPTGGFLGWEYATPTPAMVAPGDSVRMMVDFSMIHDAAVNDTTSFFWGFSVAGDPSPFPETSGNSVFGKLSYNGWLHPNNNNSGVMKTWSDGTNGFGSPSPPTVNNAAESFGVNLSTGDMQSDNLTLTYEAALSATLNEFDVSMTIVNNDTGATLHNDTSTVTNAAVYAAATTVGLEAGVRTGGMSAFQDFTVSNFKYEYFIIPEPTGMVVLLCGLGIALRWRKR